MAGNGLSERLQTPISTAELERRWSLVRAAMKREEGRSPTVRSVPGPVNRSASNRRSVSVAAAALELLAELAPM